MFNVGILLALDFAVLAKLLIVVHLLLFMELL